MKKNELDRLDYKGYYAYIKYSHPDKRLYGKLEDGTSLLRNSLVSFEGSIESIEDSFHKAVEDYIDFLYDISK